MTRPTPTWLLIGALAAETRPVLNQLQSHRKLSKRVVSGVLGGVEVCVLTAGVGPAKAERRTRAALTICAPRRVLNFGTCGALTDTLDIGQVVVATELFEEPRPGDPARSVATARPLPPWPSTALVSVTRGVWDAPRRADLAAAGAQICDMEAVAVQRAVGDLPFFAIKVVSDQAGAVPDKVVPRGRIPTPVEVIRFKRRATRLIRRALLPVLLDIVSPEDES